MPKSKCVPNTNLFLVSLSNHLVIVPFMTFCLVGNKDCVMGLHFVTKPRINFGSLPLIPLDIPMTVSFSNIMQYKRLKNLRHVP